ncbi:metallophosphoesterase [bacterium]|nr:metallophosphoesterase [bacterium]
MIRWIWAFGLMLALDVYVGQAIKTLTRNAAWARWGYWIFSLFVVAVVFWALWRSDPGHRHSEAMKWAAGLMILSVVPKLVVAAVLLTEDLSRLAIGLYGLLDRPSGTGFWPERRAFISQIALGAAVLPFVSIAHGIVLGRWRFRVIRQELWFADLPEAFDGYRIAQISDIHSGSFDNAKAVERGVEMLRKEQPDLLLFTGDLVNDKAEEMAPWEELFGRLNARDGQFSVLGNHDYGDYTAWPTSEAKQRNLLELFEVHHRIGFDLLRNEHRVIERNGDKLYLSGVENWGRPPFPQHGDLNAALNQIPEGGFTVLMSHDPSHFDEQVKQHPHRVHLTLSGHTHGMQFGIEIPGVLRWSPVSLRYPKWAGLYAENGRNLYVNRGFGYLAFPGRVGIWPEITVFTLRRSPS